MTQHRHDYEERNIKIASTAAFLGIWSMDKSLRRNIINYDPDLSCIYACWHGWQYSLLNIFPREKLHLLVSPSNDGEIIARVSKKLGYSLIRGSMKRDGSKALRQILKTLKNGGSLAYTVDGPKGPIFKVKSGVIKIAQMSQKPIVPLVPHANWTFSAPTWDKYHFPIWFTKMVSICGEKIYVPKDASEADIEELRQHLENELFRLHEEAKNHLADKNNKSYFFIK